MNEYFIEYTGNISYELVIDSKENWKPGFKVVNNILRNQRAIIEGKTLKDALQNFYKNIKGSDFSFLLLDARKL